MRAIIQTSYGSADVIELRELQKPAAGDDEVLVRVRAVSLAAGDYFGMRGKPFPARFVIGFPSPKKDFVVGMDLAGRIEAVGKNVKQFKPGDEVFGECSRSCAEYTIASEDELAPMPANLAPEQAAAVPTSGSTALIGLTDQGGLQPGQKVLVNGASGGVGTFAVQIAKALGAEVTAVCSTGNVELVRSLGADRVIDYTQEDFTQGGPVYDLILDNVASHSLSQVRRALKPDGKHIPSSGHAGVGWIAGAALQSLFVRKQGGAFVAKATQKKLQTLTKLIEGGSVTPFIDRTYSLEETAEAFRYLDQGHARGKVVITVD